MKIVLTGGPCGGKTALAQFIQKELAGRAVLVPETASLLFIGGFPRAQSNQQIEHQQRAIYFVQREIEECIALENPGHILICDRGTVDGQAYWPSEASAPSLFKSVGSTKEHEFSRYDLVIHLRTASHGSYDTRNLLRIESYADAVSLDHSIEKAWEGHPNRVVIENSRNFSKKVQQVMNLINESINTPKLEKGISA